MIAVVQHPLGRASKDATTTFQGAVVVPVPRDSGNLRRPQRSSHGLQRVFYTSALFSNCTCEGSCRFYDHKRAEGKRLGQAVLALARRGVNVLWALLRDRRCYELTPPTAHRGAGASGLPTSAPWASHAVRSRTSRHTSGET